MLSLGKIGKGDKNIEAALKKLAGDPDEQTKLNVAISMAALTRVEDADIPLLVSALSNKQEATAKAAGRLLSNLAPEKPDLVLPGLKAILEKKELPAAKNAVKVLKAMKEDALPAVPQIVALHDIVEPIDRLDIVEAIIAIDKSGDSAIPLIKTAMKSSDPLDRLEALNLVTRLPSRREEFLDALIDATSDSQIGNKIAAVRIIRSMGKRGEKAIPTLIALAKDPDSRVRTEGISALGIYGHLPAQALEVIGNALQSDKGGVKMAAVNVLDRIGSSDPEKVIPLLQNALDHEKNEASKQTIASILDNLKNSNRSKSAGDKQGKLN